MRCRLVLLLRLRFRFYRRRWGICRFVLGLWRGRQLGRFLKNWVSFSGGEKKHDLGKGIQTVVTNDIMHVSCEAISIDPRIDHERLASDSTQSTQSTQSSRSSTNDQNIILRLRNSSSRQGGSFNNRGD